MWLTLLPPVLQELRLFATSSHSSSWHLPLILCAITLACCIGCLCGSVATGLLISESCRGVVGRALRSLGVWLQSPPSCSPGPSRAHFAATRLHYLAEVQSEPARFSEARGVSFALAFKFYLAKLFCGFRSPACRSTPCQDSGGATSAAIAPEATTVEQLEALELGHLSP